MKTKYLNLCMLALVLATGCIKEEGDELTIVRPDVVNDKKNDRYTVVTADGGYMEGKSTMDSIIVNSFEVESIIEETEPCFTTLSSKFFDINNDRNEIVSVGYVYGLKSELGNTLPTVDDEKCKKVTAEFTKNGDTIVFGQTLNNLKFNSAYYVRSYAICKGNGGKSDSIIYNGHVKEYSTVLPEDLWYQRHNAPDMMSARTDAIVCTVDDVVYLYGGRNGATYFNDLWTYNTGDDVWEQGATFESNIAHYYNLERRSNGSAFVYDNASNADKLIYFVGGEVAKDTYTGTVFYYSTKEKRFANRVDHPNVGKLFPVYDKYGNPIYKKDPETGKLLDPLEQEMSTFGRDFVEDLPIYNPEKQYFGLAGSVAFSLETKSGKQYFVAFGKNDEGQMHLQSSIYVYNVEYDKTSNGPNDLSTMTWQDVSAGADGTAVGLYQPVCVNCDGRVVVGSGDADGGCSKKFYEVSYNERYRQITLTSLPENEAFKNGFEPRANAAAFYLSYTKNGNPYTRFYVGTGRTCLEDEYNGEKEQLLNDFWCYDFSTRQWSRKADCTNNIYRQGAVGFSVKRVDDYFVQQKFSVNERGMFSFGEGCYSDEEFCIPLNDNWEYIP